MASNISLALESIAESLTNIDPSYLLSSLVTQHSEDTKEKDEFTVSRITSSTKYLEALDIEDRLLFLTIEGDQKKIAEMLKNIENIDYALSNKPVPDLLKEPLQGHTTLDNVLKIFIEKKLKNGSNDEVTSVVLAGNNETALMIASILGRKDLVEMFLARGANVNSKNSLSFSALSFAVYFGHEEIVRILVSKGAHLDEPETIRYKYTPLHYAIYRKFSAIAKFLVKNKANVNVRNMMNQNALDMLLIFNTSDSDLLQLLLEKGIEYNGEDYYPSLVIALSRTISLSDQTQPLELLCEEVALKAQAYVNQICQHLKQNEHTNDANLYQTIFMQIAGLLNPIYEVYLKFIQQADVYKRLEQEPNGDRSSLFRKRPKVRIDRTGEGNIYCKFEPALIIQRTISQPPSSSLELYKDLIRYLPDFTPDLLTMIMCYYSNTFSPHYKESEFNQCQELIVSKLQLGTQCNTKQTEAESDEDDNDQETLLQEGKSSKEMIANASSLPKTNEANGADEVQAANKTNGNLHLLVYMLHQTRFKEASRQLPNATQKEGVCVSI